MTTPIPAPTPSPAPESGGGLSSPTSRRTITAEREADLLRMIPTLDSLEEAHGFRDALRNALRNADEYLTGPVLVALTAQMDRLAKMEGKL
jgi:hypothetical protein